MKKPSLRREQGPVRIAVIGAGNSVGPYLVRSLERIAADANVEIVALVDLDSKALAAIGLEVPGARLFGSQPDLHRDEQWSREHDAAGDRFAVDVELIAVPTKYHLETMLAALRAGHDVICEKPITENADQARIVRVLAKELGRRVYCIGQRRHLVAEVAKVVASGRVGRILAVYQSWIRAGGWPPAVTRDARAAFSDLGIHELKELAALLGAFKVLTVSAQMYRAGDNPGESYALVVLGLEGGITAIIEVGYGLHPSGGGATPLREDEVGFRIVGTKATIASLTPTHESSTEQLAPYRPTIIERIGTDSPVEERIETLDVLPSVDDARDHDLTVALAYVIDRTEPPLLTDEVQLMEIVDAAYASASSGAPVSLV